MKSKFFLLIVTLASLAGCGEGGGKRWVDTSSDTCLDSQIDEMNADPDRHAVMGTRACRQNGKSDFGGKFRCTEPLEDGTRKLQVKCKG